MEQQHKTYPALPFPGIDAPDYLLQATQIYIHVKTKIQEQIFTVEEIM